MMLSNNGAKHGKRIKYWYYWTCAVQRYNGARDEHEHEEEVKDEHTEYLHGT